MDGRLPGGPFPAACGKYQCFGTDTTKASLFRQGQTETFAGSVYPGHKAEKPRFHGGPPQFFNAAVGILGTTEFFAEPYKSETIMDALFEDTSKPGFPFY
jgi:hypothetical protein